MPRRILIIDDEQGIRRQVLPPGTYRLNPGAAPTIWPWAIRGVATLLLPGGGNRKGAHRERPALADARLFIQVY